jgi:hypothetical protein
MARRLIGSLAIFASCLKFRSMTPIRVQVAYWLWRLGTQFVLSAYFVSRIPIKDEGARLIPILETSRLRLDCRLGIRHVARESVVRGLEKAAVALPDGYSGEGIWPRSADAKRDRPGGRQ